MTANRRAPAVSAEVEQLLTAWAMWMRAAGRSERTVSELTWSVGRLAKVGVDPLTCSTDELMRFLSRPMAAGSRATYFGQLRAFYRFLVLSGRRQDDPIALMPAPKAPAGVPHPISTSDLRKLLASRMHRRTRTMMLLAACQGLRVSEVAAVRGEDVDLVNGTLRVCGKGSVTAVLPLHAAVADEAAGYPLRGWWFPTHVGNRHGEQGPILGNSVSKILAEAMTRAGVSGTPHSLRHWYGTELVRSGADLRTTQELLRHSSLKTTQIYVQVSGERMSAALNALPAVDLDVAKPSTPKVDALRRRAYYARMAVSPMDVRVWAANEGYYFPAHGRLSWTVLRAYETWRAGMPARVVPASA